MDAVNIALVGNPNVGKSTLFNALTGLRQHTGNWPGKTVDSAVGLYSYCGTAYRMTDLPGLYSLRPRSEEERIAAEYLKNRELACTVVVCDATCLARSLILALQVLALAKRTVLCLNLSDEAKRRGVHTDSRALSGKLGVPVVEVSAGRREGLENLKRTIRDACDGFLPISPKLCADPDPAQTAALARSLAEEVQSRIHAESKWRDKLDSLVLSRAFGYPLSLALLLAVLWLTVWGANYPSAALSKLFFRLRSILALLFLPLPKALGSFLLDGIYDTLSQVIAVMLPPMAIFFPLFTLLEDFGLLPRLAFLLDRPFERCGACGKGALTACMSLGCNAVGVTGCRIIDSPRERLIGILTASLIPCNGRFPTIIILSAMLCRGSGGLSALFVALCILLSFGAVLALSALLSRTLLRGKASGFVMELPPYRWPRVGEVLVRSVLDRTVFVLGRALAVAAPAGALLWLLAHIPAGETTLLLACEGFLDPVGKWLGLSGAILLAFVLGFPANELVLPILVMLLTESGTLSGSGEIAAVLSSSDLTSVNLLCMLLFCLFHWPCGTTLMTIKKETGSLRRTLWSILLPTALGIILCVIVNLLL